MIYEQQIEELQKKIKEKQDELDKANELLKVAKLKKEDALSTYNSAKTERDMEICKNLLNGANEEYQKINNIVQQHEQEINQYNMEINNIKELIATTESTKSKLISEAEAEAIVNKFINKEEKKEELEKERKMKEKIQEIEEFTEEELKYIQKYDDPNSSEYIKKRIAYYRKEIRNLELDLIGFEGSNDREILNKQKELLNYKISMQKAMIDLKKTEGDPKPLELELELGELEKSLTKLKEKIAKIPGKGSKISTKSKTWVWIILAILSVLLFIASIITIIGIGIMIIGAIHVYAYERKKVRLYRERGIFNQNVNWSRILIMSPFTIFWIVQYWSKQGFFNLDPTINME